MESVLKEFRASLNAGSHLVLMPVSRFLIEAPLRIIPFVFYPPRSIDLEELRTVPNQASIADGDDRREALTSLTGASVAALNENTVVAFPTDLNWDTFRRAGHDYDKTLIRTLSEQAERAMDLVRFYFCNLDAPDFLPGRVGTWNGSSQYSCALLFTGQDYESYLIAGPTIFSSVVVRGMGLELDGQQCNNHFTLPGSGEVGSIARHGLSLFSDVLESNSATAKFARAMTLFEFLAAPDSFMGMKEAKKEIAAHVAHTKTEYHRLCKRFMELTGNKDPTTGVESGIRTLVIHYGKTLEEILPDEAARNELFQELQEYSFRVLLDMLKRQQKTWHELLQYRATRRTHLCV